MTKWLSLALSLGGACIAGAAQADTNVTLVLPVTASEFGQRVAYGALAAAEAREDLEINVIGPASFDAALQVQMFQNELLRSPDAILLLPIPPSMFVEPGFIAEDQGVPVVVVTVPPTEEGPGQLFVGDNSLDMGRMAAEALADRLIEMHGADVAGTIVMGNCIPGLVNLDDRIIGAQGVLSGRLPNVALGDPIVTNVEPGEAFTAWSGAVQANPDALAMFDACEEGNIALSRLKQGDGYEFEVIAWDLTEQIMASVESGDILAVVPQPSFLHGYVAAEIVARTVAGQSDLPVGWVRTPLTLVTKENIAQMAAAETDAASMLDFYLPAIEEILETDGYGVEPMAAVRE